MLTNIPIPPQLMLYHYSPVEITEVLSAKEQYERGMITELRGTAERYSSMSFFFDPVPLDLIGGRFPVDHPAWAPGKKLWKNTIDIRYFHKKLTYTVVETPSLTKLADAYWGKVSPEEYARMEERVHQKEMTKGTGIYGPYGLVAAIVRFRGQTKKYYKKLLARPDFQELSGYYAATVPHLMIIDPTGRVPVSKSVPVIVPSS